VTPGPGGREPVPAPPKRLVRNKANIGGFPSPPRYQAQTVTYYDMTSDCNYQTIRRGTRPDGHPAAPLRCPNDLPSCQEPPAGDGTAATAEIAKPASYAHAQPVSNTSI